MDGEGWDWREKTDCAENESDHVFLCQPTEFVAVVSGGTDRWFQIQELFSLGIACDVASYWNY